MNRYQNEREAYAAMAASSRAARVYQCWWVSDGDLGAPIELEAETAQAAVERAVTLDVTRMRERDTEEIVVAVDLGGHETRWRVLRMVRFQFLVESEPQAGGQP